MTLQEILKSQGLTDEQIETITGEMKQNKIFTTAEENLDIRHGKLKGDHDTLKKQYDDALAQIEQYKTAAAGTEGLQSEIAGYKAQITDLTKQLDDMRVDAAMDKTLTAAGANPDDLDYLKFQWRKKGEITLDDNGEIKGGNDVVSALKTERPAQFVGAAQKQVEVQQLPDGDGNRTVEPASLAEAIEQSFTQK